MARKILLADDSVTAQNMGRKILADAGYDVVTVNNGSAALKRITEIKPDLIVLDVYMPGYSGLEVCQRLKDAAETAHIPVLLTVGKLEPFKPEEARRVRADAHIVKPFEASELLTAITRLEDRMVPQQSDGSRFSNSVSGVERFSGDGGSRKTEGDADVDTGWKSRLRFPSKKKKEDPEPEPEEVAAEATFRDFRKGKSKEKDNGKTSTAFTVKAPTPPGQEPGLVPDIPRDITPDELDALSALAAKLDGPIPAAENIAPRAEQPRAEQMFAAEATAEAIAGSTTAAVEVPAPVADSAPPTVEAAALTVETQTEAPKIETPVDHVEPAVDSAASVSTSATVEAAQPPAAVSVDTALLAQEPAPVDRGDEPRFADAATAIEDPAGAEATTEGIVHEDTTTVSAPTENVVMASAELKSEDLMAEQIEQRAVAPVAASAPASTEAEEPAPSDEELAEALRLLTPATGGADTTTIPSHGTLVAAGQLLAEEAARNAAAAPRWVAEPVALSPEEAAMSLEAEMFRTFATGPAAATATTVDDENQRTGITGVSAITAAVENRLAQAEKMASVNVSTVPAMATSAMETPVVTANASTAPSPVVHDTAFESIGSPVESEKADAVRTVSSAKVSEEPAEEVATATFADAMGRDDDNDTTAKDDVEAPVVSRPVEQAVESVNELTAAVPKAGTEAENQDTNSDSGGEEAMGKDKKSTWHQLRTTPASAGAGKDAVEDAKQAQGSEGAPKAMAAAAAADGSGSGSATDAGTIASIVDSVMADLRPRIVEEIAKKLAGK